MLSGNSATLILRNNSSTDAHNQAHDQAHDQARDRVHNGSHNKNTVNDMTEFAIGRTSFQY